MDLLYLLRVAIAIGGLFLGGFWLLILFGEWLLKRNAE
jgi:hypothetical protein